MIRTPLTKRPQGTLVLNRTYDCYSAGTRVEFIEYIDIAEGIPNTLLCRILGVQQTVPLSYITEKRVASGSVPARKKGKPRQIGVFKGGSNA